MLSLADADYFIPNIVASAKYTSREKLSQNGLSQQGSCQLIEMLGKNIPTCSCMMSCTSLMGVADGSICGLAEYRAATSVSRNSQEAPTSVATCTNGTCNWRLD